ncbi:MAG: hypothetical protein IVW57_00085 [Ktedonobacterales bacterium]|nr:hypothetical protein [Ktedonobacterales bacterium]
MAQVKTLMQRATPLMLAQAQWLVLALDADPKRTVEAVTPSGAVIATIADLGEDMQVAAMGLTFYANGEHAVLCALTRFGYREFTFRVA